MPELNDLSGPFRPELTFDDFSKEFLIKIMNVWQHAWLQLSEAWYEAVKKRSGTEVADNCEREAWLKVGQRVNPRYAKIANIQLRTVVDSLKALCLPLDNTLGGLFPVEYDIKDDNHVILTVRDCRSLSLFERDAPDRIGWVCADDWCGAQIRNYLINRDIKLTALKLPPRRSKDDIACQWELTMKERTS
jgi:hypothetical protein